MRLKIHYGGAVKGDQRFSRPDLEQRFLRTLQSSNGVKMFGRRRIGKSTLREWAIEHFKQGPAPYAFFDGQGLNSLSDFMVRWLKAMPNEQGFTKRVLALLANTPLKGGFEALSNGTNFEESLLDAYWQMVSTTILKINDEERLPILIIDEFSMFMENLVKKKDGAEKANRLLASLREWRDAGVKMLLTGSIGMQRIARQHGIAHDHLNDLQSFTIPELTESEARAFISQATDARTWTEAHITALLAQSSVLYPAFLVKALLELSVDEPPAPEEFAAVFSTCIRPHLHRDFYDQFKRRFKDYEDLPDNQCREFVLPVLKVILSAGEPCPSSSLPPLNAVDLATILEMLVEDGFIDFTEDAECVRHWKPASRLVTAWWKQGRLA